VTVRLRPPNAIDESFERSLVDRGSAGAPDSTQVSVDQDSSSVMLARASVGTAKVFRFDAVLPPEANQARTFEVVAAPIVDDALKGYNGTILAYGQTGTGKTYTLGNTAEEGGGEEFAGIIPRAMRRVFDHLTAEGQPFEVTMSLVQIHCEVILDLLNPTEGQNLRLREDDGGVSIEGVTSFKVRSAEDCADLMRQGNRNRVTAYTNVNAVSSRSHACVIIKIERTELEQPLSAGATAVATTPSRRRAVTTSSAPTLPVTAAVAPPAVRRRRVGKLTFVDLAGSERLKKSGSEGLRASEARSINLSLTCLGNVIRALGDAKATHVPFRNSKLTRLLQDTLTGHAQVSLVVTIGPSASHVLETLSSLMFGVRAMKVKTFAGVNQVIDRDDRDRAGASQAELDAKDDQIHQLEAELSELQSRHAAAEAQAARALADLTQANEKARFLEDELVIQSEVRQSIASGDMKALQEAHLKETERLRAETQAVIAHSLRSHQRAMDEARAGYNRELSTFAQELEDVFASHEEDERKWAEERAQLIRSLRAEEEAHTQTAAALMEKDESLSECQDQLSVLAVELDHAQRLLEAREPAASRPARGAASATAGADMISVALAHARGMHRELCEFIGGSSQALAEATAPPSALAPVDPSLAFQELHGAFSRLLAGLARAQRNGTASPLPSLSPGSSSARSSPGLAAAGAGAAGMGSVVAGSATVTSPAGGAQGQEAVRLRAALAQAEARAARAMEEFELAEGTIKSMRGRLGDAQRDALDAAARVALAEGRAKDLAGAEAELRVEREEYRARALRAEEAAHALTRTADECREQLRLAETRAQARQEGLEAEIDSLRSRMRTLEAEASLRVPRAALMDVQGKAEAAEAQAALLKARAVALEAEVEAARSDAQAAREDAARARAAGDLSAALSSSLRGGPGAEELERRVAELTAQLRREAIHHQELLRVATERAEYAEAQSRVASATSQARQLAIQQQGAGSADAEASSKRELEEARKQWGQAQAHWMAEFERMGGELEQLQRSHASKVSAMHAEIERLHAQLADAQRPAASPSSSEKQQQHQQHQDIQAAMQIEVLQQRLQLQATKAAKIEELLRNEVNSLNVRLTKQSADHDKTVSRLLAAISKGTTAAATPSPKTT
jgi:hypothetical protein